MKKNIFITICLLLALMVVVSCASSKGSKAEEGRAASSAFPQFVRDAIRSAPEDAVIGIGTARMANINQSRTIAQTRARAEISRTMDSIIQDMVRDYFAGSEADPLAVVSYSENMTVALSKSQLAGSFIVAEDMDANGNYWVVVSMGKVEAVNEINQAAAAARLAVPAAASFNAEERMNTAFDRYYDREIGYSNID